MIYSIAHVLFWIIGKLFFRMRAEGLHHVPRRGAVIVAANHASYLDPPIVGTSITQRQMHYMARASLFRVPVFSWFIRRLHAFPIKTRGDWRGGMREAQALLERGEAVIVFPEGTRSPDGTLQPPKGGLGILMHQAKVPVVPAYIRGAYDALPRGRRMVHFSPITVRFGPPVPLKDLLEQPAGERTYRALADRVMEGIRNLRE